MHVRSTPFNCVEQIMFYELESSVIERYKKSEGFIDVEATPLPAGRLQKLVWSTFEYPETSCVAFVVSVVSQFLLSRRLEFSSSSSLISRFLCVVVHICDSFKLYRC